MLCGQMSEKLMDNELGGLEIAKAIEAKVLWAPRHDIVPKLSPVCDTALGSLAELEYQA